MPARRSFRATPRLRRITERLLALAALGWLGIAASGGPPFPFRWL